MLFNSTVFLLFFFITLTLHWAIRKNTYRNLLLLVASYIFYGWWDYRFLLLLFASSLVDYLCGLGLAKEGWQRPRTRKLILSVSLSVNLGLLLFFKYFNFFVESSAAFLRVLGFSPHMPALNIILPVGISFYTFQTMAYALDVYRYAIPATKEPLPYFLYVAYFPQLVAGPIERAGNLMPQFMRERHFDMDMVQKGFRCMLWGYVLKCVVADNLAVVVDGVFADLARCSGGQIVFGVYCFAFQIYGDFAGYSYIAMGASLFFGVRLTQNFRSPFFSESVRDFWKRWNISLMNWLRDYVYIFALGGRIKPVSRWAGNVLITFVASGLWHGAQWTFIVFGLVNGVFYFMKKPFRQENAAARFLNMTATFHLFCCGLVFFRAATLSDALAAYRNVFRSLGGASVLLPDHAFCGRAFFLMGLVVFVEWVQRKREDAVAIERVPAWGRFLIYLVFLTLLFVFGNFNHAPFIYFQF
ncbi:MAG TPA: MBOAT family O-acyltransferase [Elusimicrobiota bacterium]|nr:MBOAT family O-acyltransferase [Elusimicrobiota bacterium]